MNPQNPQTQTPPPPMDARQQVVQQILRANNVLVTVSANPSVDQLSAAIGTTLVMNKLGKHATAVFSGQVPSVIQFLHPERTIEKTTDSLRDFIIALDKSKADKLRYKVEDKFVKIFITPYHTSLSQKDLEFSQGDFNIDVVIALGVKKREDLDRSITSQGRILHDAAVISINTINGAELGSINLTVPSASSLSEVMIGIIDLLQTNDKPIYDKQMATAFLTGIVAETVRFSNSKTTPQTMSVAAKLMNAGANQQLIAIELEQPKPIPPLPPKPPTLPKPPTPTRSAQIPLARPKPPAPPKLTPQPVKPVKQAAPEPDGTLQIPHPNESPINILDNNGEEEQEIIDKINIDEQGTLRRLAELEAEKAKQAADRAQQDTQDGDLNSADKPQPNASQPESAQKPGDETTGLMPTAPPVLNHEKTINPLGNLPDSAAASPTLSEIEKSVHEHPPKAEISDVKPGGSLGVPEPEETEIANNGLPKNAPPPVPPPLPMASPPPVDTNAPGSNLPL